MKFRNHIGLASILIVSLATISPKIHANTTQQKIDTAIEFMKIACVTEGDSSHSTSEGHGRLSIKGILKSGVEGKVVTETKQQSGLAGGSTLDSSQASEMRECMKPYIQAILEALLART